MTLFPRRVWHCTDDGLDLVTGEQVRPAQWASREVEDYDHDRRRALRRLLDKDYTDEAERVAFHEEVNQWVL